MLGRKRMTKGLEPVKDRKIGKKFLKLYKQVLKTKLNQL